MQKRWHCVTRREYLITSFCTTVLVATFIAVMSYPCLRDCLDYGKLEDKKKNHKHMYIETMTNKQVHRKIWNHVF